MERFTWIHIIDELKKPICNDWKFKYSKRLACYYILLSKEL